MSSQPVVPAPQPARSASKWKPVLLGCGAVLTLGLLAGVGLAIYGMFWLVRPGTQAPTNVVVGPSSAGVVRLNRAATDPGVQALFRKLMLELQRASRNSRGRPLPPWLEGLQGWQATQQSQNLVLWLPSEGTLSLERGSDDEVRPVGALNFRRFIRPMAFVIEQLARRDPKAHVRRHAGHDVIEFRHGGGLCFADSTLLLADSANDLLPVLDRLGRPPAPSALLRDVEGGAKDWDLAGSLPQHPEAERFVRLLLHAARPRPNGDDEEDDDDEEPIATPAPLLAAESARFGVDVRSADEITAEFRATYPDRVAAQAALDALQQPLLELQRKAIAASLRADLSRRVIDRQVLVEARLGGLDAGISRWVDRVIEYGRERDETEP